MSEAADESVEMAFTSTDQKKPKSLIAWRSLVWSFIITVIAAVLCIVAIIDLEKSIFDGPLGQTKLFFWTLENFFGFPICIGGFFLAMRVRHQWFYQASLYTGVFLVFPFLALIFIGYESALHLLTRIAPWYLLILLMRFPAQWLASQLSIFRSETSEKVRFGFTTLFWGSTITALLVLLVIRSVEANKKAYEVERVQRAIENSKRGREDLIEMGAVYDQATDSFTLRSNTNNFHPRWPFVALDVAWLGKNSSVDFVDCDVTDETIAFFHELRTRYEFGTVRFENCKVVKESSPRGVVKTINIPLGPLSGDLP